MLIFGFGMLALNAMIQDFDIYELLFAFPTAFGNAHFTGFLFGVVTVVFLIMQIVLIRFVPHWRSTFDTLPAGVIAIIALEKLEDIDLLPQIMIEHLAITVMLVLYVLVSALNRIRLFHRLTYKGSETYTSALSSDALWAKFWPDPTTLEGHYDHLTKQISVDPENPAIKHVTYDHGVCEQSYRLEFLKQVSPQVFDYLMYPMGQDKATSQFGMAFKPEPFGTSITVRIQSFHLSLITWLVLWCDDHVGQLVDHQDSRGADVDDFSTIGLIYAEIAKRHAKAQAKIAS